MKITSQDVEYVANLARLKIHDDEKDKLIADIESIIEFADVLSKWIRKTSSPHITQ